MSDHLSGEIDEPQTEGEAHGLEERSLATDETPTFWSGLPPDYRQIEAAMSRLTALAISEETARSARFRHKELTLYLQAFLVELREAKLMPALKDAVAIVAYRRKLNWQSDSAGPYAPFVQIVYPEMKYRASMAIANALGELIEKNVEEARAFIKYRRGIDAMYKARKPRSSGRPKTTPPKSSPPVRKSRRPRQAASKLPT